MHAMKAVNDSRCVCLCRQESEKVCFVCGAYFVDKHGYVESVVVLEMAVFVQECLFVV